MARTISATVDLLTNRTRQSGGIAVDEDFATEILTTCQQVVNIALKNLVTTTNLLLSTSTQLYTNRTDVASDVVEIMSIDQSGRELMRASNMSDLAAYDTYFFKATGTRPEAWCPIGRDFFIVYPTVTAAQQITINYLKATTIYTDYSALGSSHMELPDECVELALKLAECILLLRARDPYLIERHINLFTDTLKAKYHDIKING